MRAASNVPGLIRPTRKAKSQAEKVVMRVNAIERRRNKGVIQKYDRMGQCFTSFFMYLELKFWFVIYYRRMVSSSLSISVDKQIHSRRNEAFRKIHKR